MLADSAEIMNRGMKCLTESLGVVGAERFIALIIREKYGYHMPEIIPRFYKAG